MNVFNLSPGEMIQLGQLLKKAEGKPAPAPTPKPKPAAKRPQPAPRAAKPKPTPNAAPTPPASSAAAQEAKREKMRRWAKAARERKRAAMAERQGRVQDAAMGIPAAPSPDLLIKAKRYTDSQLSTASGLTRRDCQDFLRGRACGAAIIGKISKAIADLADAVEATGDE